MKNKEKTLEELKKFGFVMALVFTILLGVLLWRHRWTAIFPLCLICFFIPAAVMYPQVLREVEKRWMKFGEKLSFVSLHVILGLLFFVCITPLALLFRLMKRDSLGLKFDPAAKTYWTPIEENGPGTRPFTPY